jgi:redox-sensing transcriptional repressor
MQKVAIIGVGNLGRALIGYLKGKRTKLSVVAAFDVNPEKVNRVISGVYCYPIDKLEEIIKKENISIGILTVPPEVAVETTENLVLAGIKGILNYTSVRLNVPENVFLEEYDMITSLEKVTYYVKKMQ